MNAIDGDIEYTGTLRNQSPVKVSDGIEVVNLGGISGGQLLGRDVVIALSKNIKLSTDNKDEVIVPELKFIRYTKKTPRVEVRTEKVYPIDGVLHLNLGENEHTINIKEVNHPAFTNNVGLDRQLENEGDYRLMTGSKIIYKIDALDSSSEITVKYSVRIDVPSPGMIEHTLDETALEVSGEDGVLYLEEMALGEISPHDTAAMSPKTKLVVRFATLAEYDYSADKYVLAMVIDERLHSYIRVNS